MSKAKTIDMTQGPFLKNIIIFSVPIMLNSLLQTTYSTTNTIVVGRFVGRDALAAVSSNGPLWFLLVSFFIGLTSSAGILIARRIGAKNYEGVSDCVHTAITLALIFGFVIMIIGFYMARTFLTWMAVPDNIIDLSTTYLKIIFLGCPANIFYNSAGAILRGTGNSKMPLIIQSISGVINVILNLVFVIVFDMAVAGVAFATLISQYASAIWFAILLIKSNDYCKLHIKKLRIYKKEFVEILRIGLPTGISGIISNYVGVALQTSLNGFGSAVIAGCSASSSAINILGSISGAINQAASMFSSQNFGAKLKNNIKKVTSSCSLLNVSSLLIMSIIMLIFSRQILRLFTTDEASILAGMERLKWELPLLFITGISGVLSSSLIGMRKSISIMILGLGITIGVRLMWLTFIFPLNPQLYMLYIINPLCYVLGFVCNFILYKRTLKRLDF